MCAAAAAGATNAPDVLSFGPFQLQPAQRVLLTDGQPVALGQRAMDLLLALVQQAGQTLGRDELMAHAWPGAVMDDSNLRVHLAALRIATSQGELWRGRGEPGRAHAALAPVLALFDEGHGTTDLRRAAALLQRL